MLKPLKVKYICPNCFSKEGISVLLEKRGNYWVCPRCSSRYKEVDGNLERV